MARAAGVTTAPVQERRGRQEIGMAKASATCRPTDSVESLVAPMALCPTEDSTAAASRHAWELRSRSAPVPSGYRWRMGRHPPGELPRIPF